MQDVIKTTGYDEYEIINNILDLHVPGKRIEVDPTYSSGRFYKNGRVDQPLLKYDLYPKSENVEKSDAKNLPFPDSCVGNIMFDPPFLVGYTKKKPTGTIGERFHGFPRILDLWDWYSECLDEFARILIKSGVLIFKCQDTIDGNHKQRLSHVYIINEAEKRGFYCKDLFILLAKNRMIGHNHAVQQHARKFHCYYLVFEYRGIK